MRDFWTSIYFSCYRFDYSLHIAFSYINPVVLLVRIFTSKDSEFQKKYMNSLSLGFEDKDFGLSSLRATIYIYVLSATWVIGAYIFFVKYYIGGYKMPLVILLVIMAGIYFVNHIVLFKKNIYISYFEKYEKYDDKKIMIKHLRSFFFVMISVLFLILSFLF